eukprot:40549_1
MATNMFVWNCKNCNSRNNITRQKCNSCGSRINGRFIVHSNKNISNILQQHQDIYFYHGNDPSKPAKGPVDVKQLRTLYLSKTINDDTFVWNSNLIKWTRLNKMSDLYSKIKQTIPNKITFRETMITTDQIPKYNSSRRLSPHEMDEMKNNIEKQTELLINNPKAAMQSCSKIKVEAIRSSPKLNQTKHIIYRKKRFGAAYKALLLS